MRDFHHRELCHERLGDAFSHALSDYDTQRRVHVLIDEFLSPHFQSGARALDVGCGLGFFSQRLQQVGWQVTACDIGMNLLERTRARVGCHCVQADAQHLRDTIRDTYDVVVSSECIEHTPDPLCAVREMAAVVRAGGFLAISTPNLLWKPVVALATSLRLRPFDGFENFSTFGRLRRTIEAAGLQVISLKGLHLFPFQFGLHGLSKWCDENMQVLAGGMLNICILARRPSADSARRAA